MAVMDDVWSVILMLGLRFLLGFVMSVILEAIRASALFVELQGFLTLITVRSVLGWKRIETAVLRLLIWALRRLTCFMRGRSMGLKKGEFDSKLFCFLVNSGQVRNLVALGSELFGLMFHLFA